jgi:hypothetical protein
MALSKSQMMILYGIVAIALFAIIYTLVTKMNKSTEKPKSEEPAKTKESAISSQVQADCKATEVYDVQAKACVPAQHFTGGFEVEPSENTLTGSVSMYQTLSPSETPASGLPKDCFPKDQLSPADLLPADCNSKWAQSVPNCQGELGNVNFLTAGSHIGINTIGQSLRNANRQLRSDPPNPQMKVSPWLQSTIEPDVNRRPLEIGSQA